MNRASRHTALLGVVAVLFQGVLFGWHHHPLPLPQSGAPAAVVAAVPLPSPTSIDEERCEICAALHHFSAAPLALAAMPFPSGAFEPSRPADFRLVRRACERGFCARAPPPA